MKPYTPEERAERKIKKEERRIKQREANVGRAAKMHKARLGNPIAPENFELPSLNIGCSGWFYWHWREIFYPADLPTKDWFSHYGKQFKTVELNAPFYSWPTLANVENWKKQAGKSKFVYTVKANELITHIKKFAGTKKLIEDFNYIADLLGKRMGCFLYQLPPSFQYTPARLKNIVSQLNPRFKNVIEFRHKSWWNDDVYAAFKKAGIIFCSCSAPRLPDDLVVTAEDIYVRFHGTKLWYRHDYSKEEMQDWAAKIKKSGAKRVWIYFNNDFHGYAIKNAKMLAKLLKK